jgi:trans-aconitate methyltransferase
MESVAKVYARHAIGFDRVRTRELMEEPYLEIVAGLLPPPARVLDLGCGGGEPIARYFIERGYDLTGIDIAEEMLVMCRSRFPSVTWLKEDMRSMALSTRFDLLIAWDSFFHLRRDEQRQMFETFRHQTAPLTVPRKTDPFRNRRNRR